MLPPIPHSMAPVTVQQDVIKPVPQIAPVVAPEQSANESAVGPDKRHPQDAIEQWRDEQQRRQRRRGYSAEALAEGEVDEGDEALLEELPRQGLWVDVEV
ncbi:MAG: aspartate-semialdehyde dehydrogenase [Pseudomonadota bacterium]